MSAVTLGGPHHDGIDDHPPLGAVMTGVLDPRDARRSTPLPEQRTDHRLVDIGRLDLEEGGVIPSCRLAVATYGHLSPTRDNAVLVLTSYAGSHRIWRDTLIGPGHALDPRRYFVVVVNQIGGGLSISPHNADGENAGIARSRFPQIRIGDDVDAQHRLLRDHFGIEGLELVVGGGMGAQQAYEWAVRHPTAVRRLAPIAGTARTAPFDLYFTNALMSTLTSDPAFRAGEYACAADVLEGLRRHAGSWAVLGFAGRFWKQQEWRALGYTDSDSFIVDFLERHFTALDPNDLLCLARKWQTADVARNTDGSLAAALGRVTALTQPIPVDDETFFHLGDRACESELLPRCRERVVPGLPGHFGTFPIDPIQVGQIDRHLQDLLATAV
jgi:homoserine O-acetyltransferase/O-succinyltransferase